MNTILLRLVQHVALCRANDTVVEKRKADPGLYPSVAVRPCPQDPDVSSRHVSHTPAQAEKTEKETVRLLMPFLFYYSHSLTTLRGLLFVDR